MNTPEYVEKLMSLANNELFGDEKMQLEKEIQDNPALAEEFKKHLLAQDLLEAFIAQDLKKKFNSFPLPEMKNESAVAVIKKLNPMRYKLAIAASVALVLGVSSFLFVGNRYSYQNIAEGYSLEIQEVRGTNLDVEDIIEKASIYISKNENDMAITILNKISPDDDRYFMAQLLIGNASYKSELISNASIAYQICAKSSQDNIKLEGQFGYLLCQLKLASWTETNQNNLLQLSENEFFKYKEDAANILKQLSIARFFN
jgi:hypothetical protein